MSKAKPPPQRPFVPTSKLVWDDDRLGALNKEQLTNLLFNLPGQLEIGRISEETAADLERRIRLRLPSPGAASRRKRQPLAAHEGSADDHKEVTAEK
jgi:hypothetical protein